jgi:superfamily II DNA or RNA helicase
VDWRDWQRAARAQYHHAAARDFLCEATPGAGKTPWAVSICRDWLASGLVTRVVVVCPTAHLRRQWAVAAARLGLALDPDPAADGRAGPDFHGAVLTYQQVALAPHRYAALTQAAPTGVVFDELHHAGDHSTWGEALRLAFTPAVRRLALSGTPFRSDGARIPFVRYRADGLSDPDFRYDYATALRDGVCRPLYFPAYGGVVSWRRAADAIQTATFADPATGRRQRDRLKAAVLSLDWLSTVLDAAHRRLLDARRTDPTAGGLVVASSQAHARALAARLAALTGDPPALAISDDPAASDTLRRFADAATPWLVAVNMVSEGVDLPRLRVGVYATTITTALYFRQVAGRLVRRRPTDPATLPAWLYLPSDPVLLRYARSMQTARRAALATSSDPATQSAPVPASVNRSPSAFQVLGGVAWTQTMIAPTVTPVGGPGPLPAPAPPPPFAVRDRLRARHHRLVGAVARRWGLAHRVIHRELADRTGGPLAAASFDQLRARLALLETWLSHGFSPPSTARSVR